MSLQDSPDPPCEQCGLPVIRSDRARRGPAGRFCCYGCYVIHSVTGASGEEGVPVLFLARLAVAAFLAMNAMTFTWALYGDRLSFLFPVEPGSRQGLNYLIFILSFPVYLLIGVPYLKSAVAELRSGSPGIDSLIALGTTAAFVYSSVSTFTGSTAIYYDTATMVLVLVTFGRYLEANARLKTSVALRTLFLRAPFNARLVSGGVETMLPAASVEIGSLVRVLPGEEIPLDAVIVEGETSVNESLLTGESAPVGKQTGEPVLGGSTNYDGAILIRTSSMAGDTVLARLKKLTEDIHRKRSPLQLMADRITRIFIPAVIVIALVAGLLAGFPHGAAEGVLRALSVLLIACPCALGIGAALAGSIGYTEAAKRGVLMTSIAQLEAAASITSVCFDKTGTLTEGNLSVEALILNEGCSLTEQHALTLAATLEQRSEHAVGKAICTYATLHGVPRGEVLWARSMPGKGIQGDIGEGGGKRTSVKLTNEYPSGQNIQNSLTDHQTRAYLYVDNVFCGIFLLSDRIRSSAQEALRTLAESGIGISILSGDNAASVRSIGESLQIPVDLHGDLLPEAKVRFVTEKALSAGPVAMVGDGINDAPALAASRLGISLRSASDLSRVTADVTIMDDDLRRIPWLLSFGRRVRRTIVWNFGWAFVYNIAGICLAVAGVLEPVFAAGAMVVSSALVIANSSRLARAPE
jgi:Cu+-exporting ATPase